VAIGEGAVEALVTTPSHPDLHESAAFWRGKRVLVTGHTGFKGAWLTIWLTRLGARVTGLSLPPHTDPSLFTLARLDDLCDSHWCDIRDPHAVTEAVTAAQPQVVFHLAAQALVRPSYRAPIDTFATNVLGTAHVLDAIRGTPSVRTAVIITTDKVYRNQGTPWPYRETDPLGGHDPYSASKAAAEHVIACYRDAFLAERGVAVSSARAGNVIGGGDWSEDRLIPDAIRAWQASAPLIVRRPDAVRPWQHVLEPLAGYLRLAEKTDADPGLVGEYNFGPATHEAATVRTVIALARSVYGAGEVSFEANPTGPHEASWLALEVARARSALGHAPRWGLHEAVERTITWYRDVAHGAPARDLCDRDIDAFEAAQ
jgi:CDP-glucose 4,6-dehydratase